MARPRALEIAERRPSIYLDLESDADRARLTEPELYLADHEDKLVILDEVHRLPNLFQNLRGLIDRGRRVGRKAGRFLLLGSASIHPKQFLPNSCGCGDRLATNAAGPAPLGHRNQA
ncbi:AAA family ATPase [Mesorhizobium sp. M0923]